MYNPYNKKIKLNPILTGVVSELNKSEEFKTGSVKMSFKLDSGTKHILCVYWGHIDIHEGQTLTVEGFKSGNIFLVQKLFKDYIPDMS